MVGELFQQVKVTSKHSSKLYVFNTAKYFKENCTVSFNAGIEYGTGPKGSSVHPKAYKP